MNKKNPTNFDRNYAEMYDLIYSDKPYGRECDFLEEIFKKYTDKTKRILEMGCGTGNHALILADRGYSVIGIDASRSMIKIAREKARKRKSNIAFKQMTFQDLKFKKKFDAVECLFNSIDYITEIDQLRDVFSRINGILAQKGLFVFDFRNANPSMKEYDPERVIHLKFGKKDFFRIAASRIDLTSKLFSTSYDCILIDGNKLEKRFTETHQIRVFSPDEMAEYLKDSGFSVLQTCPFPNLNHGVDEKKDWNIAMIARKK